MVGFCSRGRCTADVNKRQQVHQRLATVLLLLLPLPSHCHKAKHCCKKCCLQELKQYQNADAQEIKRLRGQFVQTAAVVWQVFGPEACR
jgi:hypothetical protein